MQAVQLYLQGQVLLIRSQSAHALTAEANACCTICSLVLVTADISEHVVQGALPADEQLLHGDD